MCTLAHFLNIRLFIRWCCVKYGEKYRKNPNLPLEVLSLGRFSVIEHESFQACSLNTPHAPSHISFCFYADDAQLYVNSLCWASFSPSPLCISSNTLRRPQRLFSITPLELNNGGPKSVSSPQSESEKVTPLRPCTII